MCLAMEQAVHMAVVVYAADLVEAVLFVLSGALDVVSQVLVQQM
jgi:hypothetical protein